MKGEIRRENVKESRRERERTRIGVERRESEREMKVGLDWSSKITP